MSNKDFDISVYLSGDQREVIKKALKTYIGDNMEAILNVEYKLHHYKDYVSAVVTAQIPDYQPKSEEDLHSEVNAIKKCIDIAQETIDLL